VLKALLNQNHPTAHSDFVGWATLAAVGHINNRTVYLIFPASKNITNTDGKGSLFGLSDISCQQ